MAAPKIDIVHKYVQNPDASAPLIIPLAVIQNTADEELEANIRANSARPDLRWVAEQKAHDRPAVMVGGGPSAADYIDDIRERKAQGAFVFAMNAASGWLQRHGIRPDAQVICDAKAETASLVDPYAEAHYFASQVNEATMRAVARPWLWHLGGDAIEAFFPPARKARGGYVLLGGGASVGNSALCLAYALGFRELHLFGYDSSHRDGESHAYRQAMNDWIPTIEVEWAGRTFVSSVAMKAQAEKFQLTARQLQQLGCTLHVHGDGLLPHMWTAPAENLTERDKYRLMWQYDTYRAVAPGEHCVDAFEAIAKPDGLIIDFGCGTGRAALELHRRGYRVLLIDFADNCRDQEALGLPFIEADLTRPCPARGTVGFCTDVMEHIPPADVDTVLENIFAAVPRAFFQISTVDDVCGDLIGAPLHLSVHPHAWWRERMTRFGRVLEEAEHPEASIFFVERTE